MKYKTACVAVVAMLVIGGVAACGDGGDSGSTPPKAPPSSTPQTPSPPTPTPSEPRELKVEQTISVTTEEGPAAITLLAVKNTTSIGDAKADAGQQYVVYTMQVKNLGQTEWDTGWLESPRWSGTNGEAVNPVFVAGPVDPKLIPYDPFSSTPEPRPGEYVKATEVLGVPNTSGTLQFEDSNGNAQFNIVIK
ncbi:hypothetical protein [Streptomyces sp. NPDC005408]|uniref:hypothetical protein n=1 Tax=Streptomyces sp. NPDC005408 TaxID=3155341 RepID=UPI0033A1451F